MTSLIASHRGGSLEWPENSPTAFRKPEQPAVADPGYDPARGRLKNLPAVMQLT